MKRRVKRAFRRWQGGDTEAVIVLTRNEFRQLRPSRHPIVLGVWAAFIVVSLNQLLRGVAPTSVNVSLAISVQPALAGLIIIGALMNLVGAWIPNEKVSLGCEIGGLVLLCGGFLTYAGVITTTVPAWYATAGAAWSFGMLAGTLGRAVQIFRRGW